MRTVILQYEHRGEFLENYLADLAGGGLFVRTDEHFDVDDQILLSLRFPEITEGIGVHGLVVWRRAPVRWRSALLPGIGVSFGNQQRSRIEFVFDFCNGQLSIMRKKGRRVPTDFRVDIVSDANRISCRASDISRGGAFLHTERLYNIDTELNFDLFLDDDGRPPARIPGRVAWQRTSGPETGMGVEFAFPTASRRMLVGRFVQQIEARLSGGASSSANLPTV